MTLDKSDLVKQTTNQQKTNKQTNKKTHTSDNYSEFFILRKRALTITFRFFRPAVFTTHSGVCGVSISVLIPIEAFIIQPVIQSKLLAIIFSSGILKYWSVTVF